MSRRPARAREDEAPPEPDRLAGFPHPRETQRLVGQERAEAALRAAFDEGRMHHGWLLAGPEGIGKATLAYRLARYVLASEAERRAAPAGRLEVADATAAARQILAQSHPGLLVIRRAADAKRTSSVIRVDEVRRLKGFLQLTADEGAWRVVIVDPADDLNQNAANALLKSLEEPPRRTLFLLVTAQPGRLLPTIRSRCRTLELAPLVPGDLWTAAEAALAAAGEEGAPQQPAERARLAALSNGSVRRLLGLTTTGGLELYDQIMGLLAGLPELDMPALHALAEQLAPAAAEERLEMFYALLLDLIARLVRGALTGDGHIAGEAALAQRLMTPDRLASWAELWETIIEDRATAMALNLDKRSLVLKTGFRMRETARAAG